MIVPRLFMGFPGFQETVDERTGVLPFPDVINEKQILTTGENRRQLFKPRTVFPSITAP